MINKNFKRDWEIILFEMLHPHKKPRGSIRRNKKRRSKRNEETLS